MIHYLDTSAVLNGCLSLFENTYISPLVIAELENIKTDNRKDEHTKYLARKAIREILSSSTQYKSFSQRKIQRTLKKYNFLSDINDHRILCEAILLNKDDEPVKFITSDGAQFAFAQMIPGLETMFFEPREKQEKQEPDYCGWNKYYPNENDMALLYSNPEMNILGAKTNEFCEIYEGTELKDVLFWNGAKYRSLKYKEINSILDEKIRPRNLEQKMLFHLLQDENIKIKLCQGTFGCGKTFLMLHHALQGVKEGRFSKIIYVRNNVITKGSRELGYLGGSLLDKVRPYLMPIADLTSEEYLDQLIGDGILEPVPLGFMRGRDFSGDVLIFVDEAENLTKENIQLLIGRIGEGSELWLAGDLKQIDHKDFEKNNGIRAMIKGLAGEKLFGMMRLIKSERSLTSQLADKLDNI